MCRFESEKTIRNAVEGIVVFQRVSKGQSHTGFVQAAFEMRHFAK